MSGDQGGGGDAKARDRKVHCASENNNNSNRRFSGAKGTILQEQAETGHDRTVDFTFRALGTDEAVFSKQVTRSSESFCLSLYVCVHGHVGHMCPQYHT